MKMDVRKLDAFAKTSGKSSDEYENDIYYLNPGLFLGPDMRNYPPSKRW
uniref:Uncharacterized protein n=1 Tax=Candidatus Kentrum sp. MB TaxID=2138164 RepID=A0A450XTK1_9GAMM|nr:MAG: hypothetical protein BECKMB1821G_GA0114241_100185 [Candidatus Kentron sp. MB]VFK32593.1 MAG: hypothetical protein BECKMB1821I_GA0114274_10355 [Candidatus Kentron sp. MB]VFK75986.1 MAG: hypothetical protein BECKMB1821H_GA0114242_10384 [Candidatus Kentron sp. MB]